MIHQRKPENFLRISSKPKENSVKSLRKELKSLTALSCPPDAFSCSRLYVKINTGRCWLIFFPLFLAHSLALHQHKVFPFHHQMKSRWKLYHKREKKEWMCVKGGRSCVEPHVFPIGCDPLCLCIIATLSLMLIFAHWWSCCWYSVEWTRGCSTSGDFITDKTWH